MKRGDFVDIYEDPLTCLVLEGKARLILFIDRLSDGQEMWKVEFVRFVEPPFHGNRDTVIRFISSTRSLTEKQPE